MKAEKYSTISQINSLTIAVKLSEKASLNWDSYIFYALWVDRRSLAVAVAGKQTNIKDIAAS